MLALLLAFFINMCVVAVFALGFYNNPEVGEYWVSALLVDVLWRSLRWASTTTPACVRVWHWPTAG